MRIVVDTNVLISALLSANTSPGRIVAFWRARELELVVSPDMIAEVRQVLSYAKIRKRVSAEQARRFLKLLETDATLVTPHDLVTVVQDDPDDDKFVALAMASGAEYIVSGDKHLLSIGAYQGVKILNPADFLTVFLSFPQRSEKD